jgi:non-ribosomal peptide synthetase component F
LYRTGDLVRYRPDGNLEYLDRVDFQVKVRGFRIELEEITTQLKRFDEVEDAIVLAVPDERGENRLVAYVVPRDASLVAEDTRRAGLIRTLREGLAHHLPDYMIPAAFLLLPELPLTPSGKIDRRALLELDISTGLADAHEPPRTPAEELLASIWEQVLGVDRVGRNDNFFELGGHSILATQLAARIRKVFEIDLPLNAVFETRTLADLAALIEQHVLAEDMIALPPIEPAPRPDGRAPLSLAQQRLWFLDQLEPGNLFYNIPTVIRMTGDLKVEALEAALNEIIRRHESLRTTFGDEGGEPVQIIHEHLPISPDIIDLRGLSEAEREEEAARLIREIVRTPFNLATGPLLRARLIRLTDDEHIAVLVMHHIISDGWSMGVFVQELTTLYEAFVQGQDSPLPPLRIQYADYAIWQRQHFEGEALEKQLDYWREQLAGLPPLLELPTDRPRPPVQTSNGATYTFRLDRELTDRLYALSREQGVTLFMTLLAGYQTLLSRYSGMEDIAVGSAVANRSRAELEPLIGFFVNTLVFRTDLSGAPSFKELLKRVREVTLGAFAHQDVPFEKLVDALQPERNLSHTPLFQVAFALQNLPMEARELPGLTVAPVEAESGTAQYDLLLMVSEDD